VKNRLTYKVGAPIPITGVQFGMRVEFGYDCLIPADFNNDVSSRFAQRLSPHMHLAHDAYNIIRDSINLAKINR